MERKKERGDENLVVDGAVFARIVSYMLGASLFQMAHIRLFLLRNGRLACI